MHPVTTSCPCCPPLPLPCSSQSGLLSPAEERLPSSRYETDFTELRALGRGGYGVVVAGALLRARQARPLGRRWGCGWPGRLWAWWHGAAAAAAGSALPSIGVPGSHNSRRCQPVACACRRPPFPPNTMLPCPSRCRSHQPAGRAAVRRQKDPSGRALGGRVRAHHARGHHAVPPAAHQRGPVLPGGLQWVAFGLVWFGCAWLVGLERGTG